MTTQTKDRARGANGHDTAPHDTDGQHADTDGQRADTGGQRAADTDSSHAALIAEQVDEAAVQGTRQAHDSILAMVHQGQDGIVMMARMWTESVGRLTSFGGAAGPGVPAQAVRGGYDLFEQLLAGQRQFVDRLIAEQRRFAEQLLTPPGNR